MRGMPEIRLAKPNELDLRADIEERKHLMSQMVGSLYPSIVSDEIEELKQMITNLKYMNCAHVFYNADDFTAAEIARKNVLAVAVLSDGKLICKRCGYEQTSP